MDTQLKLWWFNNQYTCTRCGTSWEDECSCMCDDRCPKCDREMTPYASTYIGYPLTEQEFEFARRRLAGDVDLSQVVALAEARMEGR